MWQWLVRGWHWPQASLFTAIFLLAILPPFAGSAGLPAALVFAQLPIYLLHQWEEHRDDRFRIYVNKVIAGDRELLTPENTFWINCLCVWVVDLVALNLAVFVHPAAALVAGYLALTNAVVHVIEAAIRREYNPGLLTAVVLFVPIGGWCVWAPSASLLAHSIAVGFAIGGHSLVFAYLRTRLARLQKGM